MNTETIEGYISRDYGPITAADLHCGKLKVWPKVPYRNNVGLFLMPNFPKDFSIMELPHELFPEFGWDDGPKKVKITIEIE